MNYIVYQLPLDRRNQKPTIQQANWTNEWTLGRSVDMMLINCIDKPFRLRLIPMFKWSSVCRCFIQKTDSKNIYNFSRAHLTNGRQIIINHMPSFRIVSL